MSNRKPARWAALKEAALARPRARSSPLRRRSARRSSRGLQGRTRGAATAPADLTARDGAHGAAAERRGRPRTRSPARGPEAAARPQHLGLPAPRNGARRTDGRTDGPPRPPRPAPRRPHPRPPLPVPLGDPERRGAAGPERGPAATRSAPAAAPSSRSPVPGGAKELGTSLQRPPPPLAGTCSPAPPRPPRGAPSLLPSRLPSLPAPVARRGPAGPRGFGSLAERPAAAEGAGVSPGGGVRRGTTAPTVPGGGAASGWRRGRARCMAVARRMGPERVCPEEPGPPEAPEGAAGWSGDEEDEEEAAEEEEEEEEGGGGYLYQPLSQEPEQGPAETGPPAGGAEPGPGLQERLQVAGRGGAGGAGGGGSAAPTPRRPLLPQMLRLHLPEPPADSEDEEEEGAAAQSSRGSIPMDPGNGGSAGASRLRAGPLRSRLSARRARGAGEEDDGGREAAHAGHPRLGQPDLGRAVAGGGAARAAGPARRGQLQARVEVKAEPGAAPPSARPLTGPAAPPFRPSTRSDLPPSLPLTPPPGSGCAVPVLASRPRGSQEPLLKPCGRVGRVAAGCGRISAGQPPARRSLPTRSAVSDHASSPACLSKRSVLFSTVHTGTSVQNPTLSYYVMLY